MLNLPGNFVRGAGNFAGNIVGGTVHAVASVGHATGINPRRLSIDGTPVVLRDKLNITVKVGVCLPVCLHVWLIYLYLIYLYFVFHIILYFAL
jgi:hypothetical protein